MGNRTTTLGLAALAAAAALAGCGSSGPSKADFAKKADALCVATNKANPPKPETARNITNEIAIRTQLDQKLKALKVPDSEKGLFASYNADTERIIAELRTIGADLAASNKKKAAADSQVFSAASLSREQFAIKLGFKTCGRRNPAQ
jgi:predicted small lipoprotein YifL